jgi:hypothetical protein
MDQLLRFFQNNFSWLVLLFFAWGAMVIGIRYYRHKRTGLVFPHVPSENLRFDEKAASGYSHKSLFTKYGGAKNCLCVTVTDTEVWIRTPFPFNVFSQKCDLEHRIPRACITGLRSKKSAFARAITLDFRDDRGQIHTFTLMLKRPDDFLKALNLQVQVA